MVAGQLREAMSAAPSRPMIQPEPSLGPGSRWLGLLLVLLSLLDITWTEVQPPQLPEQAPTLAGKRYLGKDGSRGTVVNLKKGYLGISRSKVPRTEPYAVWM